jgi:hypothetical protein
MSPRILSATCAIVAAFATAASEAKAGDTSPAAGLPATVIELFTSQGCSSCPPADALLDTYAKREGIIALSFHVDYWDYLGWADEFASADFSARQRQYARDRGDGSVYTPQAVIDGRLQVVGSSATDIEQAIGQSRALGPLVHVSAIRERQSIDVHVKPAKPRSSQADILLAVVLRSGTVQIRKGENSGRTITYRNVVRSLTRIGAWDGNAVKIASPLPAAEKSEDAFYVVLVQQDGAGPILGAAVATAAP